MTFWSGNSAQAANIQLKRNWRFQGTIRFNEGTPTAAFNPNAKGPINTVFTQGKEIKDFLIHSFEKPSFDANVVDLGQNPRNGQYDYTIGKIGWKEVSIQVYDSFSQGADGAIGGESNPAKMLWEWLRSLGYDADAMAGRSKASVKSLAASLRRAGCADLTIEVIDAEGGTVEKFEYLNPIISNFSLGKASYGSDDLSLINMTFQVASVKYTSFA